MKQTYSVLIGNTDDKLPQAEWSRFCKCVRCIVLAYSSPQYFEGFTASDSDKQSACWVFDAYRHDSDKLVRALQQLREMFQQDAIALVVGDSFLLRRDNFQEAKAGND